MSHKKIILLIIGLVFLTFANSLVNGFVGDDFLLFAGNDFYRHPSNIAKIFSAELITTPDQLRGPSAPGRAGNFSGCVAYRPVTALSFFADAALWKLNPRGMRLTNVLLHIFNSLLVYTLIFILLRRKSTALFTALLFGVHPLAAELVNNAGYRSDLLVTLFFLLTAIAFMFQSDEKPSRARAWGFITLILALLSKETAVCFPFVLMLYHCVFESEGTVVKTLKKNFSLYLACFLPVLGYLYLYVFVVPNAALTGSGEVEAWAQVFLFFHMLGYYLTCIFMPFEISVVPTFYAPDFYAVGGGYVIGAVLALALSYYAITASWRRRGVTAFFMLWFIVTYLPVSNIFPLVNPMAYRYLYLPGIGAFAALALLTRWAIGFIRHNKRYRFYRYSIKAVIVVLCMITTVGLNRRYQNDFTVYEAMRTRFPGSAYPYLMLGTIYKQTGHYPEAIAYFHKYMENKPKKSFYQSMPGDYIAWHQIGVCYVGDPDRALAAFVKSVQLNPGFADGYASIGKAFLLKKDFPQALIYINQALLRDPLLFSAYVYLVETYWQMGEKEKAQAVLTDALGVYPDAGHLLQLKADMQP